MNKTPWLLAAIVTVGARLPVHAGDRERAAVGSLLGGVIGAAVGGNVSGQDGAVVGAVIGATAGSYIAVRDDDRRRYDDRRYYRDDRYYDHRRKPQQVYYVAPPHGHAYGHRWKGHDKDRGWDRHWKGHDKDRRGWKDDDRRWDRRKWDD
jgi:uncharacterized protein YcfJ